MSTTAQQSEALDFREQIVRIDRAIAETQKFQAEASKLIRDRSLAPITLALTGVGTGAALFAAAQAFLRLTGP